MSRLIDKLTYVEVVLAADVVHTGTFTVPYPIGTTQQSFLFGRAGANNYIMVDYANKFTQAASQISLAYGASLITVTNSTGQTLVAGSRVYVACDQADGDDLVTLSFQMKLAKIANGDLVTDLHPNIAGSIVHWEALITDPVTTAAKLSNLNLEIGTTDVTGGVLALTSALATPLGKVIAASAITANNVLTRESLLSVEASGTTAFVEGEATFFIQIRRNLAADSY